MIFLFDLVEIAFNVMYWLIIIRVLLSWIRHDPYILFLGLFTKVRNLF